MIGNKMKLMEAQFLFSSCFWKLLKHMEEQGYTVTLGDVYARDTDRTADGKRTHKVKSQHYKRLAVDINLFKDSKWLQKTEDHKIFGDYWEGLNPFCRWGGRYNDGNHYEVMENGWRK